MNNIKINKVYFDNGVDSDFSQRLELKKLIKDGENKNIVMPSLSMLDRTYDGILELSEKFFSKNDYVFFINELTDLETIYNEINKEKLSRIYKTVMIIIIARNCDKRICFSINT